MDRRSLQDQLGISRSTSHRHTTTLDELGIVSKSSGEYVLTDFGDAVADVAATFEGDMETAVRLAPVIDAVSEAAPSWPIDAFADATITEVDQGDPFGPLARFVSLVEETDTLRMADSYAIAPTYIDEIHQRVLDGMQTEAIESVTALEDIMANYPKKCIQLCASDFLTLSVHQELPFGVAILDHRTGIGVRDPETGAPRAFVDTAAQEARAWAETLFDSFRQDATRIDHFNPKALREAIEAIAE